MYSRKAHDISVELIGAMKDSEPTASWWDSLEQYAKDKLRHRWAEVIDKYLSTDSTPEEGE